MRPEALNPKTLKPQTGLGFRVPVSGANWKGVGSISDSSTGPNVTYHWEQRRANAKNRSVKHSQGLENSLLYEVRNLQ